MKYSWLESMVKEGKVRPEVADRIYADCSQLRKEANQLPAQLASNHTLDVSEVLKNPSPVAKMLGLGIWGFQQTAPFLLPAISGAVGAVAGERAMAWDAQRRFAKEVQESHGKVMAKFKDEPEKAQARFQEIASHAPAVAANSNLVERLIARTLHEGLSDTDVEKLLEMQGKIMSGGYEKLRGLRGHLKTAGVDGPAIRPEVAGMICADILLMCKTAGAPPARAAEFMRHYLPVVGMMAAGSAAAGAVTGGLNALRSRAKAADLRKQLDHAFEQAMKSSDADKEPLHTNPEQAREAFKALAHFAPHVALQPQAARSFMNKIVSYGSNYSVSDLKDLTEIQRNMNSAKGEDPFVEGLINGSQFFGLNEGLKAMHKSVGDTHSRATLDAMGLGGGRGK